MAITLNGSTGITTPAVTNEGSYTGDGIVFADTTPSNTLVTTTGGNVGVGTSSPAAKFHIKAGNANQAYFDNAGEQYTQVTWQNNGTDKAAIWTDNTKSTFSLYAYPSLAMNFFTGGSERMRINSSGNVFIKCTATPSASVFGSAFIDNTVGAAVLYQSTTLTSANALQAFFNPNGNVGSIFTSGTSTGYSTSSDYRLKENIAPMTSALAVVGQLKPCTYIWKTDGSSGQGFIAHELAEIVPDCVNGEKDAVDEEGNPKYQGIDTSFLVATLTAAIQEQQAIITDLKSRIEALEQV